MRGWNLRAHSSQGQALPPDLISNHVSFLLGIPGRRKAFSSFLWPLPGRWQAGPILTGPTSWGTLSTCTERCQFSSSLGFASSVASFLFSPEMPSPSSEHSPSQPFIDSESLRAFVFKRCLAMHLRGPSVACVTGWGLRFWICL